MTRYEVTNRQSGYESETGATNGDDLIPGSRMTTAQQQKPTPLTNAAKVARARAKLLQEGGRRLPTGYLQPNAAAALDALLSAGYAKTVTGVISSALLDAARKIGRRQ